MMDSLQLYSVDGSHYDTTLGYMHEEVTMLWASSGTVHEVVLCAKLYAWCNYRNVNIKRKRKQSSRTILELTSQISAGIWSPDSPYLPISDYREWENICKKQCQDSTEFSHFSGYFQKINRWLHFLWIWDTFGSPLRFLSIMSRWLLNGQDQWFNDTCGLTRVTNFNILHLKIYVCF